MRRPLLVLMVVIGLLGLTPLAWTTLGVPPVSDWFAEPNAPPPPAPKRPEPTGPRAPEIRARRASAAALLAVARKLTEEGCYTDSRDLLRRGLLLDPGSEEVVAAFEEIRGVREDRPPPEAHVVKGLRDQAFRKAWPPLIAALRSYTQDGLEAGRDRIVRLSLRALPPGPVRRTLGLVWWERQGRWVLPDHAERLGNGDELVEGCWLPRSRIVSLNELHAEWSDPWILTDGTHSVLTTCDYRFAKEVLEYVASFREFFLERFRGALWLRKPNAVLPVWICRSREDYAERLRTWYRRKYPYHGDGYASRLAERTGGVYLSGRDEVNAPCVVPVVRWEAGRPNARFWTTVRHEVTHQLVAAYLFHERRVWSAGHHDGLEESIAELMEFYRLAEDGWWFNHAAFEDTLDSCRGNLGRTPSLRDLLEREVFTPLRGPWAEEARIRELLACLAAYCFLGESQDHRVAYLGLLENSCMRRLDEKRFRRYLTSREMGRLEEGFAEFLHGGTGFRTAD